MILCFALVELYNQEEKKNAIVICNSTDKMEVIKL
ncbi:Uncharacterised protein [Acinetobacter baumannii]|nr:Uncharacterised protein [Acinetobacter baumannii]SVL52370.1 Uncharacterised protein [Klebsiella pneumoniae]